MTRKDFLRTGATGLGGAVLSGALRHGGRRGGLPVYDLNMLFAGYLNAPYPTNNIPHPMVFAVPDTQTQTKRWRMATFEGTQYYENVLGYGTHGDFLIMDARQVQSGYEFAPRPLPSLG